MYPTPCRRGLTNIDSLEDNAHHHVLFHRTLSRTVMTQNLTPTNLNVRPTMGLINSCSEMRGSSIHPCDLDSTTRLE